MKSILSKIGVTCTAFILMLSVLATTSMQSAFAYDDPACQGAASTTAYCQNQKTSDDNPLVSTINKVSDFIAYISGFIAVILVIIGGYKFVLSNGDPQKAQSGRITILYAVVGIVVIIVARVIIAFVLNKIKE